MFVVKPGSPLIPWRSGKEKEEKSLNNFRGIVTAYLKVHRVAVSNAVGPVYYVIKRHILRNKGDRSQ